MLPVFGCVIQRSRRPRVNESLVDRAASWNNPYSGRVRHGVNSSRFVFLSRGLNGLQERESRAVP